MALLSLFLVTFSVVKAQTIETITKERNLSGGGPQIKVTDPFDIQVNKKTNKIYIANFNSATVTIINSNSGSLPKIIPVGAEPRSIVINEDLNKIYVANFGSNSVSVIDGYNDTKIKEIQVGNGPRYLTLEEKMSFEVAPHKIYVANTRDNSVSVIDDYNDRIIKNIPVGKGPSYLVAAAGKIYVANTFNNSVSVINGTTDTKEPHDIPVGSAPSSMAVVLPFGHTKIYVQNVGDGTVSVINITTDTKEPHDISVPNSKNTIAGLAAINTGASFFQMMAGNNSNTTTIYVANNAHYNSVSVINGTTDTKEPHDIPVGKGPMFLAADDAAGMIYVANAFNHSISVINGTTNTKATHDIRVGNDPRPIASGKNVIYVGNLRSNTISVIDDSTYKIAVGVIFNTNPPNSGKIMCTNKEYPTGIYVYVDAGTNCTVEPTTKDFEFNTWTESPLTNRNSSTPLVSSGNLTVNQFGVFTVNFKPVPPTIPTEYLAPLYGIIISTIIGWSIPSIVGWIKARTQRTHLKECIKMIDDDVGKSDQNTIEDKIFGYYVDGKLNEDHRQVLKDKISEYYEKEKGSDGYGAPFT